MSTRLLVALVVSAASAPAWGQIVSYEASLSLFPEQVGMGWTRIIQPYQSDRWLSDGWLVQFSQQVQNGQVTEEEEDAYRRNLPEEAGLPTWFLQWRVITDTPPVFQDVGPAAITAGGTSGVNYHFVIGDSQVQFLRDSFHPIVYADVQPGIPHTFRLELAGIQTYAVFVDGVLVDSGTPVGQFPVTSSFVIFRGQASAPVNTTKWQYVRFGRIPPVHSGDYDSNGVVDSSDLYFFLDCLLTAPDYDNSGPGCRFADMNGDGKVDGADIELFANRMMGA